MRSLHGFGLGALLALACGIATPGIASAQDDDFAGFDLEALMDVEVFSVSKKAQSLADSAAAVYVLNQEDIHRSGATTIAELLRIVPGMEVARIDSHNWAISARGFNDRFSNKLLVMIDGRSVYSPLFAGVHWDVQDTMLEDIDRIEVVRGPGGTIWGANAVNGVINIITKSSTDTQGALVSAGGGSYEHGFVNVRQGAKIAESGHMRVYGKYFDRDHFEATPSSSAEDDWDQGRVGFRADWDLDEVSTLSVQGDAYSGDVTGQSIDPIPTAPYTSVNPDLETEVSGGSGAVEFRRWLGDDNVVEFKSYFDSTNRGDDGGFKEERRTLDFALQHNITITDNFDLAWGLGYRLNSSRIRGDFALSSTKPDEDNPVYSAFIQGDYSALDDKLRFTLGSKFEDNDFTGFEWQPSARVLVRPTEGHSFWGAVSRAVRTPSNAENSIRSVIAVVPQAGLGAIDPSLPGVAPFLPCGTCDVAFGFAGVDSYDSEELLAYELGWRGQITERLTLDVATYYNDYDDLRTTELNTADPVTIGFDPANLLNQVWLTAANNMSGEVYGAELAASVQPTDWWKIRSGYNYIHMDLELDDGVIDPESLNAEDASPEHQIFAHSMIDLPGDVNLDTILRWKDRISAHDVDSAWNVDVRVAWAPLEQLEFSVVGQNLTSPSEREFGSSPLLGNPANRNPRGVYGKITWTP